MRLTNIQFAAAIMILVGTMATADTITLRNGEVVQGTYIGGTARLIRVDVNGDIRNFDIERVQSVTFTDPNFQPPPPPPPPDVRRDYNSQAPAYPAPPPGPPPLGITMPIDTRITVRLIDSVNSQTSRLGETFRASLDEPVVVDGQTVIRRGADVLTKLVEDQQSGKIAGRTVLTLALVTINVNGRLVEVTSTDVKTESSSRGARTGAMVGGGAALGAIVGGLAGGGKGAAIGAGSGAALGGGTEILTHGQTVKIPSETRLTFRLQSPAQL
ncbi:MAG: hypothetical protein ABSB15_02080 [Bryobacteraceae bacterium]|jgi:hypothetical protein